MWCKYRSAWSDSALVMVAWTRLDMPGSDAFDKLGRDRVTSQTLDGKTTEIEERAKLCSNNYFNE